MPHQYTFIRGNCGYRGGGIETLFSPKKDLSARSNPKFINATINHHEMTVRKGSNRISIFGMSLMLSFSVLGGKIFYSSQIYIRVGM